MSTRVKKTCPVLQTIDYLNSEGLTPPLRARKV